MVAGVRRTSDHVIDLYAPMSFLATFDPTKTRLLAPTWVPPDAMRRLAAYKSHAAQLSNVARIYIGDAEEQAARREYGDPALLVSRIASGVLGDGPALTVAGAVTAPAPDLPDPPAPAAPDASPLEQRIADVAQARWERDATAAVDEWAAAVDAQPAARERQTWLDRWVEREAVWPKLARLVQGACGIGDAVTVVAWDDEKQRPTVRVFDAGFYFPTDADGDDFPRRVHLAWEEERPGGLGAAPRRWVRRLTWELVLITATMIGPVTGDYVRDDDGTVTAPDGVEWDQDRGVFVRRYPWQDPEEPGSEWTCVYSDGSWPVEKLGGAAVDDFPAEYEGPRIDLGVDFIPLVHLQGVDVGEDFGRSVLALVAQLLDDLAASDTDVAAASALAAGPAVAISGTSMPGDAVVAPGTVWRLGENGKMDVLDMSAGLSELRAARTDLGDRLSVNSQVPAEVMGRVDGSTELSGIAIALRFGPFRQLVEQALRPQHLPKLALIPRFAQRLAQVAGVLEPGETPVVSVVPGPYLPSDLTGLFTMVAEARAAGVISEEQAVALLAAGGVEYGDLEGEVARIRAADPERAKFLFEATGNDEAAAAWAGVEPGAPPADPGAGT